MAYLCHHMKEWNEWVFKSFYNRRNFVNDPRFSKQWQCLTFHKVPTTPDEEGLIECSECKVTLVVTVQILKSKDYFGKEGSYSLYSFKQQSDPNWHLCEHLIEYQQFVKTRPHIYLCTEGYMDSIECQLCKIRASWPEFKEIIRSN